VTNTKAYAPLKQNYPTISHTSGTRLYQQKSKQDKSVQTLSTYMSWNFRALSEKRSC